MYILFLAIFLFGCSGGKHEPQKPDPNPKAQLVHEKYDREFSKAVTDFTPELYLNPQDCDYTLWAGKSSSIGLPGNMDLVEYTPGYVHRRPKDQGECWPDHSASTTSNDMITGYVGARFRANDADAIQRIARFAAGHGFIMGEPSTALSEVFLKPALAVLIARMQNRLQNEDTLGMSGWTPDYQSVSDDYAQHIQSLQIVYHGEAYGTITDQMRDRIKENVGDHPDNYTFQAISSVYSGQYDITFDLLLDDSLAPPSYVRGERPDIYGRIEWLWAANLAIREFNKKESEK